MREHNLHTVPGDPVTLANRLGITVSNAVFSDSSLSGIVTRRGDDTRILVNVNEPPVRKRFTIAHELGHLLLHLDKMEGEYVDHADEFRETEPQTSGWAPARRREYEANVFASALLMDSDLVMRAWAEGKSLEDLAREFNVSEIAMTYRLRSLRILR